MDNDEYILRMRTANEYSTSQPAIGKFLEAFEKWTNNGYKIIVLTISSALSGTYNTALAAAAGFDNIEVVDTKTTTRGMVYLLDSCIEQLKTGLDINTISENLREKAKNILTFVTIDNLDNLVKGGRLSKSAALIGGLLNIKVLTQLVHSLIKHINDEKGDKNIKHICLPNTLADEYIKLIKEELQEEYNYTVNDNDIFTTTPIISTHTGENAVGILIELV